MRNRVNQIYESYWNYTAAFTNYSGDKFIETLKTCLDFIDANDGQYSEEIYSALQNELQSKVPMTGNGWDASQRKRINQLVKLGFISPFLSGYPQESREYIDAKTDRKRKNILSKIVYKHANLCNSTTVDVHTLQLTFFLKSLEEIGSFSETDLATLMTIDIASFGNEFATREDLDRQYHDADVEGFMSRKYNQIGHLKNVLGKLEDLTVHDNAIYFKTDAIRLFGGDEEARKAVRDPYLQRVYKSELEEESTIHFECETPKCMLEGLSHPVLIASHIKPYKYSDPDEAFDVNNGLLLSKNTDSLFDLGYMTFDDSGIIIPSKVLDLEMCNYLSQFRLHRDFINPKRMDYMKYHRSHVFEKRFSSANVRRYVFEESPSYLGMVAEDTNIQYNRK